MRWLLNRCCVSRANARETHTLFFSPCALCPHTWSRRRVWAEMLVVRFCVQTNYTEHSEHVVSAALWVQLMRSCWLLLHPPTQQALGEAPSTLHPSTVKSMPFLASHLGPVFCVSLNTRCQGNGCCNRAGQSKGVLNRAACALRAQTVHPTLAPERGGGGACRQQRSRRVVVLARVHTRGKRCKMVVRENKARRAGCR